MFGFARMMLYTLLAIARTLPILGPITRKATGKGTYGPNTNGAARTKASGAQSCAIRVRRRFIKLSRDLASGVRTMIFGERRIGQLRTCRLLIPRTTRQLR